MNCEQMTLLMSAWLDGELSEQEEQQMKEHLEQCPACRELMEQLQALHTSFSDLEEIPAPEGFADSVMERIAKESKPKVVPLFKRPQIRALTAMAACVARCVGFGSLKMGGGAKSEDAAAPAPMPESAMAAPVAPPDFYRQEAAVTESVMEHSKTVDAPAEWVEPMEPVAPAAGEPAFDAAVEAPAAMAPTICETGPDGETVSGESQIVLPHLPEGLEDKVGPLMWEERAEDGALCARLTADQAELVLELVAQQGIDGVCIGYAAGNEENWILVLQPN